MRAAGRSPPAADAADAGAAALPALCAAKANNASSAAIDPRKYRAGVNELHFEQLSMRPPDWRDSNGAAL
jgi:hypothetical protein